jgi:hypothetical protein
METGDFGVWAFAEKEKHNKLANNNRQYAGLRNIIFF